jgi:hypothetical protein
VWENRLGDMMHRCIYHADASCNALRDFNNIDLLLACDYDFRSAVAQLEDWLEQYLSKRSGSRTTEAK